MKAKFNLALTIIIYSAELIYYDSININMSRVNELISNDDVFSHQVRHQVTGPRRAPHQFPVAFAHSPRPFILEEGRSSVRQGGTNPFQTGRLPFSTKVTGLQTWASIQATLPGPIQGCHGVLNFRMGQNLQDMHCTLQGNSETRDSFHSHTKQEGAIQKAPELPPQERAGSIDVSRVRSANHVVDR